MTLFFPYMDGISKIHIAKFRYIYESGNEVGPISDRIPKNIVLFWRCRRPASWPLSECSYSSGVSRYINFRWIWSPEVIPTTLINRCARICDRILAWRNLGLGDGWFGWKALSTGLGNSIDPNQKYFDRIRSRLIDNRLRNQDREQWCPIQSQSKSQLTYLAIVRWIPFPDGSGAPDVSF